MFSLRSVAGPTIPIFLLRISSPSSKKILTALEEEKNIQSLSGKDFTSIGFN